jgi:DNA-binding transcriptional LysR family regulator
MSLDVQSLTLLVQILDAGNLAEAARRMKMSRANVSYHLNQVERAIGQQLIRRTTRRLEATEIGLKLYEHGRVIQNELLAARESIATLGQELSGRVRLSVPSGYGQLAMSPWLLEFKRLHPAIVLDVLFENRVEDLMRDEVDVAVRVLSEPPQNLVARDLGPVRFVACASRAYAEQAGLPQRLEDLQHTPLLTAAVIGKQLRLAAYQDEERHEVLIEPTLISENFMFLREAVLAGLGVGLVPDYTVRDLLEAGTVVTALDAWRLSIFGTRMHLLYMPNRHHTRAMATFIEYIQQRAREGG